MAGGSFGFANSFSSIKFFFVFFFFFTFRFAILMVVNRSFLETEMTIKNPSTIKLMLVVGVGERGAFTITEISNWCP